MRKTVSDLLDVLDEWSFGRILCPACGEETVEKLAIYTANQFDHVRVEACETCHYYIKTVDLTKNGLLYPSSTNWPRSHSTSGLKSTNT